MAKIDSKVIFVTTSPRTPAKMIPEIELLAGHFSGQKWDVDTQKKFMKLLKDENFFNGDAEKDPAFSARDRITRAPKALGFVTLSPTIELTPAGHELINSKHKEEIFLRQLLKFQVPSPYHLPSEKAADFWIKPYLELFRLIRHFGTLKFDELRLFGLQLTNYKNFDIIVSKIEKFRIEKVENKGNYKNFYKNYLYSEIKEIYKDKIQSGETKTRESKDKSISNFINTQASNLRDYADACFRYLRFSGVVTISHIGKSLSIVPNKQQEVDYFLKNVDRNPCFINDTSAYINYLTSSTVPKLLTDNRDYLTSQLAKEFPSISITASQTTEEIKNILIDNTNLRKEKILSEQVEAIKDYKLYEDITTTFEQIKSIYDAPLILEWNTWRAMTMLDGGDIKANLKFDDYGNPMSTAQGNMADIICDYDDFKLTVEVTMQTGQKQYEAEGEPVSRHLAKVKKETSKPTYCLFIAPKINEACIAHFYTLHKTNISYYGGTSTIVPLPLEVFMKMVEDSHRASYTPEPKHVQRFFELSNTIANSTDNENEWYTKITKEALNWLN